MFIYTVTLFCFYMAKHKSVIYSVHEMYILHLKQGHHMPIYFHLISNILEVYTWDIFKANIIKNIFSFVICRYITMSINFNKFCLISWYYLNNQCMNAIKINLGVLLSMNIMMIQSL